MQPIPCRIIFKFTAICLCIFPLACQSQQRKAGDFEALKANLEIQQNRSAYDSLHFLLTEHYTDLNAEERKTLRKTLKKYASWPFETLCPDTEPGAKITLSGRVSDANGKGVPGAKLHIFQTNHEGYYSPYDAATGRMMEQDPRLEGFLTTDSSGAFRLHTIRPASYPKKYEGRLIPGHIHVIIHAEGFQECAVQMVFEEDPAMTEHWVEWAKKSRYPIVKLEHSGTAAHGNVEINMTRL